MTEEQEPQTPDVERLLKAIEASGAEEIHIESGSLVIRFSRSGRLTGLGRDRLAAEPATSDDVRSGAAAVESAAVPVRSQEDAPAQAVEASSGDSERAAWIAVSSPIAGVFYRCPKPGEPPFVAVGDRVSADDPVGIVEVMKLLNTVVAGTAGTVREIAASDAAAIGFGEPLIWIDPDA